MPIELLNAGNTT